MPLKRYLQRVAPPELLALYRRTRQGQNWSGVYPSFAEAPKSGLGSERYSTGAVEKTKRAILAARQPKPTPAFDDESLLPIVAAIAGEAKGRLRILDFGGGPGTTYAHLLASQGQPLEVEYHVVDLEWAVQAGSKLFADDDRIQFHRKLPDLPEPVDIILLQASLNYVEAYSGLLAQLFQYKAKWLLLGDIYAGAFPTFATSQRVLPDDLVPIWFFNLDELIGLVSAAGYRLILRRALSTQYELSNLPEDRRLPDGRSCSLIFSLDVPRT